MSERLKSELTPCCTARLEYHISSDSYLCRKCGEEHPALDDKADHTQHVPTRWAWASGSERQRLIVELISKQDARKWDVKALVEWASSVADEMLGAEGEH